MARGRPRADEVDARREAMLDAALELLIDDGPEGLTVSGVAERAGASKATVYAWFGGLEPLISAVVEREADASAEAVKAALGSTAPLRDTLEAYCRALLGLLTGPRSVAMNRTAMSSAELARVLLASGRHRVGPLVEDYLAKRAADGELRIDDVGNAYRLLYGLTVRDAQIRVLLGEPAPDADSIRATAAEAVDVFLGVYAPHRSPGSVVA